jgi:hypothetical protein
MRIADLEKRDIWYAKAVLPVLAYKECTTIVPMHRKKACYLINEDRLLLVKRSRTKGKKVLAWQFNFPSKEQKFLAQQAHIGKKVFLFLVCGNKVCGIKWNDAVPLMDHDADGRQQALRVACKNGQYSVTGSNKSEKPLRSWIRLRADLLNYFYSTSLK